jgi:uncharacterized membrane protein YgaE (UPF0421/DUF939 family)
MRESLYTEKRKELQELEKEYRRKQDGKVGGMMRVAEKMRTNQEIIDNLREQISQNKKILANQNEDNEDIQQKISTQRDTITHRDNEILELRD